MERKSYKYVLFGTFAFLFQATTFLGQEQHCGTTEATQKLHAAHPELIQKEVEYNKQLKQAIELQRQQKSVQSSEQVFRIPIVFHIIHQNGSENISDAQIFDQVDILNRDYAKLNADTADILGNTPFDTLAANIHVEFRLAHIDPNGNCTNGIDRIYSHRTNSADDNSKLNPWPRNKYLNVWVVKTIGDEGVAGYAYFPSGVDASPNIDGVLILHNYIGSIGTSTVGTSRALTHEIGHYLSLYHPWGGTNSPEVACGDDAVEDTPVTMGHLSCTPAALLTPHCDATALSTPYTFDGITTSSGSTDTTTLATSYGADFGHFSAVGVSTNSMDSAVFAFSGWDNGAVDSLTVYDSLTGLINTSKYYEVTVTPGYGSSMSLTGLTFNVNRSATGVRSYAVRSSINSYASNLAASVVGSNSNLQAVSGSNEFFITKDTTSNQTGSKITLSGASYTNMVSPVTFRFYGWNAEDSTGTFGIDNVAFTGTAGTIENTQNYMDYSYCSVMFTKGQKERMRIALAQSTSGRNHLWTAANLAATGADDAGQAASPCVPKPNFYSTTTSGSAICTNICVGGSLKFNKQITLGTATSYVWTFEGGSPSTSTASTPTVTYANPGDYTVHLKVTNASGSDSLIKTAYIHVSQPGGKYYGLAQEGFNGPSINYWDYWVNNYDNNSSYWNHNTACGYNGNGSMMMYTYGSYPLDIDDFITPSFDLSHVSGASMTFRCSAASSALAPSDLNEVLKIYSSTNCGQTWAIRSTIQGTNLINAGYHPEYFVPSSSSQWALQTVTIPSSIATGDVRFKFEYTSGNSSNNIYIDDINIVGVLGVNDMDKEQANVSVYPNPSNQTATVSYHLVKKSSDVKVELIDLLGKKVVTIDNGTQTEGDYSVEISKQQYNINSGIYFVKLTIDNIATTKRLIFTE